MGFRVRIRVGLWIDLGQGVALVLYVLTRVRLNKRLALAGKNKCTGLNSLR